MTRVRAVLDGARRGAGGALSVVGEAGTGKTALLTAAAESAEPMRVLRTQGIESEAPLAFAGLQRLLLPLMPLASRLPAPQARALSVAFGAQAGDGSDRFLVFLAALGLLGEAARDAPLLAVVDDAHWLDEASAAALLFVARRLEMEPVAMIFGARLGDVRTFEARDVPVLQLTGLRLEAVTRLLRDHAGREVSREVGAQLLATTGGNPLALVELPRVLTAGQLSGTATLPRRLPVTGTMERVFLDRARRLSTAAQLVLLVAAADDSASPATVTAAAALLGIGSEALAEAECSGLVRVDTETLTLRHPLVRSAVYSAATSLDRRRVHAALAEVLTSLEDADRRAWHRAASVDEPDRTVVDELEAAARRAEQRGGYEAASAAWERSAALSADVEGRTRRLLRASYGAWVAGSPLRAGQLADAARREATDPLLRADSARLRARVEWNTGSVDLAHRMLLEAARDVAPHDPDRAREAATEAVAIAAFGGPSTVDIDAVGLVSPPAPTAAARQRCCAELLWGLDCVLGEDWHGASRHMARAFEAAEGLRDADNDLLPNLAVGAWHVGDHDRAAAFTERLLTAARTSGVFVMVLYALTRLVYSDVFRGSWATAVARATEAVKLGEETGQEILAAGPRAWLLLLTALRGEEEFDQLHAELAETTRRSSQGILDVIVRDVIRWAEGVHAVASPATAFHRLAQISTRFIQRSAGADRIEAAVRSGQRETAGLWINDLEQFAEATGQKWAAALAQHGRALLADDATAETHFKESLKLHESAVAPFHRARTELAYGEYLRRVRRRVDAREHLRAALAGFEDLQAAPWAERAAQELRASGETARKRGGSTTADLTPQELQVAQMVQQGLTNKEVAAQLFLSPRTVDFHLRNVFTKTGVTSRIELAHLSLA